MLLYDKNIGKCLSILAKNVGKWQKMWGNATLFGKKCGKMPKRHTQTTTISIGATSIHSIFIHKSCIPMLTYVYSFVLKVLFLPMGKYNF